MSKRPNLLFVITVYNGGEVVFDCLRSAASMQPDTVDIDILVLDDASPAEGFSEEVEALCGKLQIGYYRSPRNLGIPRNVNLGLLRAIDAGYDYVVINNSDIIVPEKLCDALVEIIVTDDSISSVTAWSNNVSIYSLPNDNPDRHFNDQQVINWLNASLRGQFGDTAIDVPVGISFCILIPTKVLRQVGLMDPVYGRGYCEETDWSLRSQSMGYRICLGPGAFVYHRGQGSTSEAGVLPAGHSTVPENERIIDLRYPLFRGQVDGFINSDILDTLHTTASRKILTDAGALWGYDMELGRQFDTDQAHIRPIVTMDSDPRGQLAPVAHFLGVTHQIPVYDDDVSTSIIDFFGAAPNSVRVFGPDRQLNSLADAFIGDETSVTREIGYPSRV